ncbi:hypothetical protein F4818DRAFT_300520 [Hypoxylon cercidicola]|nr:hypothetical protein F4818DRAFT_300520 [Hypoxylon cercidicola]
MNMKAKRKTASHSGQGWTNSYQNTRSLSDTCHPILLSIAKATHDANEEYLSIVKIYLRNRARKSFSSSQPRFTPDDLDKMKAIVTVGSPIDATPTPTLLDSLKDVSYTDIWDRAADNMAFLRGHWKHQTQKHQDAGRQRAMKLRACQITIEKSFNQVEKEMRNSSHDLDLVCDGIQEKIDMLHKYEKVYPVSVDSHPTAPLQSQTSILILLVLTFIVLSLIPMGVAWMKSTGDHGSVHDSDFWLCIMTSIGQAFGLFTSVYIVGRRSADNSTAWKCALLFTGAGIICCIVPIPLYLYVPTMWSSLVSFFASMAQFGVMLEIATMTEHPKLKQA